MTSPSSEQRLPPDLIQGIGINIFDSINFIVIEGSIGAPAQPRPNHPPTFSFMPIGPAPAAPSYIPPVRPVVNNAG